MAQILTLTESRSSDLDRLRYGALEQFLLRRGRMTDGEAAEAPHEPLSRESALLALQEKGLLSFLKASDGAVEVSYTPSRTARQDLLAASDGHGFPKEVQEKQREGFRKSEGAIFRFPFENGEGHLEVFITDWSPSPAAAALAVHPSHPFAAAIPKPMIPIFTGSYVRHPLTGDLLPVWVADWVKPDFGTGAVLVNPAHDATDLRFGRQIGLPIRFGLAPESYDGEPATWPHPPVIKSGRTVRTGPYDGLSVSEAMERYFQVLSERQLAERTTDLHPGSLRIARLVPDEQGSLAWDPLHVRLVSGGAEGAAVPVSFQETSLLDAALEIRSSSGLTVLAAAGAVAKELLFLRLLHHDLRGSALRVSGVLLAQRAQGSTAGIEPEVLQLGSLAASPPSQVAVLKQGSLDQVRRFLRVHQELLAAEAAPADGEEGGKEAEAFGKVKEAIGANDPARAFNSLYAIQKQLAGAPPKAGALARYFALAQVAFGLEAPPGLDLEAAWSGL